MTEARDDGLLLPMRLQRFLARSGVASRRGSESLMSARRVRVNGVVVTEMGAKVDPAVDVVEVDGVTVGIAAECTYLALHKPRSVMTTMRDPEGRVTVAQYVPVEEHPGLFPVGRLDFDTTGLLLFTTDGELSHRLLHPRRKVPKCYRALVDGHPDEQDLAALSVGVELDDGMTAPAVVEVLENIGPRSLMEIVITEGRKRQVRRMFSAVGHPVIELERVTFGPVSLGGLEPGRWRRLSAEEVTALRDAVANEDGES
ncbi:MAG: pseudouridine synthase [Coriobacteriia bacterium]|nr:pseudouridine synthase [Coriobacteriia bacterium]